MSAATIMGFLPCFWMNRAILAVVVVLPLPWSPTIMTALTALPPNFREVSTGPMSPTSSS
ncbi:MAG: hypothetical protein BWX71_02795 [Deltaproteobacteria bacterium ADurb.Bin072]|nr:MAG: hypothetical protein BWX71_02795 [Deltaproteobacteria bacterium ADurb.Bin072]